MVMGRTYNSKDEEQDVFSDIAQLSQSVIMFLKGGADIIRIEFRLMIDL